MLVFNKVQARAEISQANNALTILGKAADATGGDSLFQNIRNFTIITDSEISGAQGKTKLTISETVELPNRTKQVFELQAGKRIQVLNGQDSWKRVASKTEPLGRLEQREMERGLFRDTISLFQRYKTDELTITRLEDEVLGGKRIFVLQIKNVAGDFFELAIDSERYLILKKTYRGAAESGLVQLQEVYGDYREVSGIMLPHQITVTANNKVFIQSTVTAFSVNRKLGDEFFYED